VAQFRLKEGKGMRTGAPFRQLSIHITPFQQTIINSSIHSEAITGRGGGWGAQPELAEVITKHGRNGITGQREMERLFALELPFWDVLKCGARMGEWRCGRNALGCCQFIQNGVDSASHLSMLMQGRELNTRKGVKIQFEWRKKLVGGGALNNVKSCAKLEGLVLGPLVCLMGYEGK
jgi:hypothetical protein